MSVKDLDYRDLVVANGSVNDSETHKISSYDAKISKGLSLDS